MDNTLISSHDTVDHIHLYVYLIYLYLPEVDLEEGQTILDPVFQTLQKIFGTYALITLLRLIFALAHETICILYLMVGSTHHIPNPVIYVPLVSPT